MDQNDKRCGTCRKAQFEYTPSGRIMKGRCGRCTHEVEWPKVPFFIQNSLPRKSIKSAGVWSEGIWPDSGVDCPCWEAKE